MAELKILHNPRCSKSRQTLTLLQEKGYDPVVVEYLKQPLNEAEIRELFAKLGLDDVKSMMRVKEAEYKDYSKQTHLTTNALRPWRHIRS